jgi:hypothetical protein
LEFCRKKPGSQGTGCTCCINIWKYSGNSGGVRIRISTATEPMLSLVLGNTIFIDDFIFGNIEQGITNARQLTPSML